MKDARSEAVAGQMAAARRDTLALFDLAREEHLHDSPGFGFRPIIWHLAHIGTFEEFWILNRAMKAPAIDERYQRIFDPINTPREQSRDLPSRRAMEEYLDRVRGRVLGFLEEARFDAPDPLVREGYVFDLVLQHEYQHQETILYLLQMLDPEKKHAPQARNADGPDVGAGNQSSMITIPAGTFQMGADGTEPFAYDNELPRHAVHVPAFEIDRRLTTNEEYAHFIREGGYRRREWWSEEGWAWREKENLTAPLYWTTDGSARTGWRVRTMFAESSVDADSQRLHPVSGLSWHEAEAYAHFMKKRLPTEAEWEKAASWDNRAGKKRRFSWGDDEPDPSRCNFGNHYWGTTPAGSLPGGASPAGCLDMTGNVWEWTADEFRGFPGFVAFPYPEYSELWFDGDHRVLKGGSWATRAPVLRTSFRNFFRRHFRIAFAGIRCARDA